MPFLVVIGLAAIAFVIASNSSAFAAMVTPTPMPIPAGLQPGTGFGVSPPYVLTLGNAYRVTVQVNKVDLNEPDLFKAVTPLPIAGPTMGALWQAAHGNDAGLSQPSAQALATNLATSAAWTFDVVAGGTAQGLQAPILGLGTSVSIAGLSGNYDIRSVQDLGPSSTPPVSFDPFQQLIQQLQAQAGQ